MQKQELAKAYVSSVIRHFNNRNTQTQMTTWFGSGSFSSSSARKKLLSTLNSVDHMISNVEFFPGPKCSSNTYAYVYPKAYDCDSGSRLKSRACTKYKGKFVFYLCPFYFTRPSEMVETLVHEGAHHASAYLDDVNFGGRTAYGRSTCKRLAKASTSHALNNADNFCYYLQDCATQLGSTGGGGSRPAPPPVGGGGGGGARTTTSGCACKKTWRMSGGGSCTNYCCNPDGDAGGPWCFTDKPCSATWGTCAAVPAPAPRPAPTPRRRRRRAVAPRRRRRRATSSVEADLEKMGSRLDAVEAKIKALEQKADPRRRSSPTRRRRTSYHRRRIR